MIKWKCIICRAHMETEVRPQLRERLCIKCKKQQQRTAAKLNRVSSKRRAK